MTTSKSELRGLVRARARDLSPDELSTGSRAIAERLLTLPQFLRARSVMLYVSVGAEPDTSRIISAALGAGKRVSLPRITGPGTMEAREIRSPGQLVPGKFSIPAPGDDCPPVMPEEIDFILVPGVAFARDGGRLGNGAGFYDRFLSRTGAFRCALCRGAFLFDALPMDEHDAYMDVVVTETGVLVPVRRLIT